MHDTMKGTRYTEDSPSSLIEHALDLTPLGTDSTTFISTNPLWCPPGSRGVFGGVVIAQTLAAAQLTVPAHVTPASMHCYFIFAGDGERPILYHVERVVDRSEKAVRTVHAKQGDQLVCTAIVKFCPCPDEVGDEHSVHVPLVDPPSPDEGVSDDRSWDSDLPVQFSNGWFVHASHPEVKKVRQWARAKGQISLSGGRQAHLGAFAYISDSFLLATVYRVHSVPRFSSPTALRRLADLKARPEPDREERRALRYFKSLADVEAGELGDSGKSGKEVGMMVSLSHSIYFHCPRAVRADEWMLCEMETPWAGDGRGLGTSRWWSGDGVLIATCVQEGVMRLKEDSTVLSPREGKL